MKYLLLSFLLSLTLLVKSQPPNQKLSNDSVRYYQRELNKLWRDTYDSLKNSDRYKELVNKLDHKNRRKVVTVELLANIGLYFNDFKNLNARLKSMGQEDVKPMTPSVGASLAIGSPIMTYGLEFSAYVFDNSTATFKGMHGRVFLATNLFKKSTIVLNPQIGYSGSLLKMFIHKSADPLDFNDLVTTQPNTIQLDHSQDYLDLALGLKFHSKKNPDFYWQFLRVGYRYAFKEVAWKMRGATLTNAPLDRNNQFYIQFCLGFDR